MIFIYAILFSDKGSRNKKLNPDRIDRKNTSKTVSLIVNDGNSIDFLTIYVYFISTSEANTAQTQYL